jgi:glutaredoxin
MQQRHELVLVMYSRSKPCPFVNTARYVLAKYQIPYDEIFIDQDASALERVLAWTGFQSVPTLIVAYPGDVLPIEPPSYLAPGASPRGVDRGAMLTEPHTDELERWLIKHQFLAGLTT